MEIFDKLNEKQREAVMTTEGFVRVIAGAGSGKTKLLVSRYAYLVQEYGIDSSNILCVTFTNKAAGEMKKRIRALIGPEYDTSLICTYHGFCARLLRENPEKLFFSKGFQIIDTSQQKAILEDIYQKRELKLDYASFESMLKKIAFVKSSTAYVPRFCDPEPCQIMSSIKDQDDEIIEEFMQRQKAVYSLDFSDLMSFALYLLGNDSEVRDKWQDRLNYIQVDEFQDSSKRELLLVDVLSGKYSNLMIVGDPDQNIYEWRGSDVRLLVDFDKDHTPTETIFLNQNYRSTPQILRCANHLIEKNDLRLKKDLFTKAQDGPAVIHYHSSSDEEETRIIAENIRSLIKTEGYSFSDFAVLYRSGFLSRVIEKKFVESGVPYEIYGGVKFYQRMEILDIIAYLRLIAFDDDISFKRIINTPRRKFGRSKMAYLESIKESDFSVSRPQKSLFETLKDNLNDPAFRSGGAEEFVGFIESMRQFAGSARISEIVNSVTAGSGYEQYIRELGDEERLENLSEFKRIANEFERSFGEDLSLTEFLHQVALQSGEDEEKPRDAVKLMTIHAAKGLEFPVVFIVGFTEGIFPSSRTIEERKKLGLEEERRLCYVAITRAKEHLFIMDSEGMSDKGIKKLPSRFLGEIGENNYTRIGRIPDDLMREAYGYIAKTTPHDETVRSIDVGSDVEHHIFGHGKVVGKDERKGSFIIRFDRLPQTRNISGSYFDRPHNAPETPAAPAAEEETEEKDNTQRTGAVAPETSDAEEAGVREAEPVINVNLSYDRIFAGIDRNEEESAHVSYDTAPDTETGREDNGNSEDETALYEEAVTEEEFEGSDEDTFSIPVEEDPVPEPDRPGSVNGDKEQKRQRPAISDELRRKLEESENLWKRDDVPHTGWTCIGITDLGEPVGICQMCGYQIIRYVHHMIHPNYRQLNVGCVCAGKMEGDIEAARKREQDFKNKQTRRENFLNKKWKESRNGNSYMKIKDHIIVLYRIKNSTLWKYSLDGVFCAGAYDSREKASGAAFEAVDRLIYNV